MKLSFSRSVVWQNRYVATYPDHIARLLRENAHLGNGFGASACGVSAAFECGSSVGFAITINDELKTIDLINYTTNGCGFMIAAAELIAVEMKGRTLKELHGVGGLETLVLDKLGIADGCRQHCAEVSVAAFRNSLAEYRLRTVREFQGEKALVCTCFGVTEEKLMVVIESTAASDVDEVSAACNAGSGCGSCRMLIQELIDSQAKDAP